MDTKLDAMGQVLVEILGELRAIREETARGLHAVASNTETTAKTSTKWDDSGLPLHRYR